MLDDNDFLPGLKVETFTSYTVFQYFSINISHAHTNIGVGAVV